MTLVRRTAIQPGSSALILLFKLWMDPEKLPALVPHSDQTVDRKRKRYFCPGVYGSVPPEPHRLGYAPAAEGVALCQQG